MSDGQSHYQAERGVTMAFVAMSMGIVLGVSALVIDLGHARLARRSLATATDASALAASQDLALGRNPCPPPPQSPGEMFDPDAVRASTAGRYLLENDPDAVLIPPCEEIDTYHYGSKVPEKVGGRIIINATRTVDNSFAGAIGAGQTIEPSSSTTAEWGPPSAIRNLAPVGLCLRGGISIESQPSGSPLPVTRREPRLVDIFLSISNEIPPTGTSDPYIIRLYNYRDDQSTRGRCGNNTPSNSLLVDFNHGPFELQDAVEWAENGFPEPVDIDGAGQLGLTGRPDHPCILISCVDAGAGDTDERSLVFDTLRDSNEFLYFPVFNYWYRNPWDQSRVHLVGVLRAKLLGGDYESYLEFEVDVSRAVVDGVCCGSGIGTGRLSVVSVCAVDPNENGACTWAGG